MLVQNQITLQIDHLIKRPQIRFPPTPLENCHINIQVAHGWTVTGHYQNNTLQTISLLKISQLKEI